jgi:hypothetical protein
MADGCNHLGRCPVGRQGQAGRQAARQAGTQAGSQANAIRVAITSAACSRTRVDRHKL